MQRASEMPLTAALDLSEALHVPRLTARCTVLGAQLTLLLQAGQQAASSSNPSPTTKCGEQLGEGLAWPGQLEGWLPMGGHQWVLETVVSKEKPGCQKQFLPL